jgi:hypothetical protein
MKQARAEKFYAQMFEAPLPIDIPRKKENGQLAAEIRSVLEPVLIRRNRLDLKMIRLLEGSYRTSTVKDPEELFCHHLTSDSTPGH